MATTTREQVGSAFVDSGHLMVAEPLHFVDFDDFYIDDGQARDLSTTPGDQGPPIGVVVRMPFGDGVYPVYVEREDGRVVRLVVDLDEDEHTEPPTSVRGSFSQARRTRGV